MQYELTGTVEPVYCTSKQQQQLKWSVIKQLQYNIVGVSNIPVSLEQAYFPRFRLSKIGLILGNWNLAYSLNGIL